MKVTGERLVQVLLWPTIFFVMLHLLRERVHSPRYPCIITVHNEVLCFEGDHGRMFRPERRFSKFTMENGEP